MRLKEKKMDARAIFRKYLKQFGRQNASKALVWTLVDLGNLYKLTGVSFWSKLVVEEGLDVQEVIAGYEPGVGAGHKEFAELLNRNRARK
jgi:hypothetical protein